MKKRFAITALGLFSLTISKAFAAPVNPAEVDKWMASVTFYLTEANGWIRKLDNAVISGCAQVVVVGLDGKATPMNVAAAEGEHPILRGARAMQSVGNRIRRIESLHEFSIAEGGLGLAEFTGLRDVALMSDENVTPFAQGLLGAKLLLNDIKVIELAIAKRHQGDLATLPAALRKEIAREVLHEDSALRPHLSDWQRKQGFPEALEQARELPYLYRSENHHRDAWQEIVDRYLRLAEALELGLREDFPEIIEAIAQSHNF